MDPLPQPAAGCCAPFPSFAGGFLPSLSPLILRGMAIGFVSQVKSAKEA